MPDQQSRSRWEKATRCFDNAAEFCNVGIAAQVIPKILGGVLAVASLPWLAGIAILTDPLIYFFRAAARLTRLIGRQYFQIEFRDDPAQLHARQLPLDIATIGLFILSIAAFVISSTNPPMLFVAWAFGLSGIGIVYEVDYCQKEKDLLRRLHLGEGAPDRLKPKYVPEGWFRKAKWISPEDQCKAATHSRRLYLGILIGLAVMLLCGSAALFSPPAVIPLLSLSSRLAGFYLAGINTGRVINSIWPGIFSRTYRKLKRHLWQGNPAVESPPIDSPMETQSLSSTAVMGRQGLTLFNGAHFCPEEDRLQKEQLGKSGDILGCSLQEYPLLRQNKIKI